ncbi:MAG: hypothetical protein QOK43_886 [Acidimicrobiaceae bacterium]|nr:hypothetical protein [Acidimicrobiaceae bacterium]
MKRLDPAVGSSLMTLGVIVAVGVLLSIITVVPSGNTANSLAVDSGGRTPSGDPSLDPTQTANDPTAPIDPSAPADPSKRAVKGTGPSGSSAAAAKGLECAAGKNGGETDVGVTGSAIKLASTIVADGPGASFLSPVRTGMTTVVNRVNKTGGVCGRRLDLSLRNDSWDADRGKQFIQNFVEGDKVFALAVVPSSEGLRNAKEYIAAKQVPVVGTDGMLIHQYKNPWIWPVAASTISTMHVMAKDAYERSIKCGAECHQGFGIVFDAQYHFGVEGAFAYNAAIKRLTGHDIDGYDSSLKSCTRRFCGIQPGKPSYAGDARTFNEACYNTSPRCDFVAFLLEPDTALSFFSEGWPVLPTLKSNGFGLAQPLFTRQLAENCKSLCDGMWVWTGYNPPIEALANTPGVAKYANEVHNESASADVTNQFLEGGYLGMSLLVTALEKLGPNVSRNGLKNVLDSMSYDSGLSQPLAWSPGNHFANVSAQAFAIQYKQSFNGWRQMTGFLKDPWPGQDIPAGE